METDSESAGMQILQGLINGPPIWVWPLLVLLLIIGWRACKQRQTSMILYYFLPFMGLMSVQSIASLPHATAAWAAFGLGYVLSGLYFYKHQAHWLLTKSGLTLGLAGEWVTMTTVMVVFWGNFVRGTLDAVAPMVTTQLWFGVLFAAIVGAASGSFLGRSLHIVFAPEKPGV